MLEVSGTAPATLTKALLKAANELGLAADLPALLSLPADDAAALQEGSRALDPQREEWRRALKVVGLFRSLLSLVGTSARAREWLGAVNPTLGAKPIDLLRTPEADRVYRYLDAVQKHELRLPPNARRDH